MTLIPIICVVLFYCSLFIELFFYDIPSVVATKKILNTQLLELDHFSDDIKKYLTLPYPKKLIVFVLPIVFVYLLHVMPLYFLYEVVVLKRPLACTPVVCSVGFLLVFFGRVISHLYLNQIKRIKMASFQEFVADGLFKYSRNPGLIGLYISFFGFLLIRPSVLYMVCFAVYLIHMHYKILFEEDYLEQKHGKSYVLYKQKSKRYL